MELTWHLFFKREGCLKLYKVTFVCNIFTVFLEGNLISSTIFTHEVSIGMVITEVGNIIALFDPIKA